MPERYSGARQVEAVGAWIAFITCFRCGATITLDDADQVSAADRHDAWHNDQEMFRAR